MRQDVTDLKKLVHGLMAERGQVPTTNPESSNYYPATPGYSNYPTINLLEESPHAAVSEDHIQDTEEYVEETLSLDEVEKEMIKKALLKHNGKRKSAAKDLNISERTLYRKIKEYDLD